MECDIIALGESLRGFDFDKLTNYRIVLNNGYKYIKHDLNVWYDKPLNPLAETIEPFGGRWKPRLRDIQREPGYVSNCNSSLILAVNIAIQLGYKKINIYGADFKINTYLHFYDSEPASIEVKELQNKYFDRIRLMWDELNFLEDECIRFI